MEKFLRNSMEKSAYDKIKLAIVKKILLPGTQLIEQSLTEQLNISRTPIRNAFKKLEQEGFIKIIPNRGAFIIEPSKEEILNAFKMRIELECMAIDEGLSKVTETDLEQLNELIKKETEALKNQDVILYLDHNRDFHLFLAKKTNNPFLISFLSQILEKINVYLILYDTYYNVPIERISGIKEHQEIHQLISHNKQVMLKEYIRFHLNESLSDIHLDSIPSRSLSNL